MKLHNTLTKSIDTLTPLDENRVSIYSCGPTVYDRVHIGNLSAFIVADTLRRVLAEHYQSVKHVMNLTDVDDKTIQRSAQLYPDLDPRSALAELTKEYAQAFYDDMQKVGCDITNINFIKATDEVTISGMQKLVLELLDSQFAYLASDGVYFSIEAYKNSGKVYGQLVNLSDAQLSIERVANDEYDKESIHDFALWKKQKPGEPSWQFTIDSQDYSGRPGWHLECSVMSQLGLGQPFDIHTGGIDLAFPHHENEIAQSTANQQDPVYAQMFVHNEHILVDGRKMSKSLNNFHTLQDLEEKDVDPLAFRLLVLQSHYRKQTNFSFDNAVSATNRLNRWRNIASLRWQIHDTLVDDDRKDDQHDVNGIVLAAKHAAMEALESDMNSPEALSRLEQAFEAIELASLEQLQLKALRQLIEWSDRVLGLQLENSTPDVSDDQKQQILARRRAREQNDWNESDRLRDILQTQGIELKDSARHTIWKRH